MYQVWGDARVAVFRTEAEAGLLHRGIKWPVIDSGSGRRQSRVRPGISRRAGLFVG
jgi:hypothetical protein